MMNSPNTLILTESPPSATQGFGVTLATLIDDWPKESLFIFYRSRKFEDQQTSSLKDYKNIMTHASIPGNAIFHAIPYALGRAPSWLGRYSDTWLKKKLKHWKPQVIYSWFYSLSIPKYGFWLSQYFNIPHIIHIGDDESVYQRHDNELITKIYKRAAIRIAISHEMKKELEERYSAGFEVLHNGAADNLFTDENQIKKKEKRLLIRYIGSLLYAQHWQSIEDIVSAVKIYNSKGGKARFEIYCDEWTKKRALELADNKNVFYCGFAPKPENYKLMRSADILLLPITFAKENLKWFKLSFPTKLPEYLASGTPTLIYGPRGTAPVEFCIKNNIAIVLNKRSVESLVEIFSEIDQNRSKYRERAIIDRKFAKNNLSASAMQHKFKNLISLACSTI